MEEPIERFAMALANAAGIPLLAVGSGGSFTAAHFASHLHQNFTGLLSKAVTPLEFTSSHFKHATAVLVLSAAGNNVDIVGCFREAIMREPTICMSVCLREQSRLSLLANTYHFVDLITAATPIHRDGFLATNSLLAFVILLSRAYAQAFSVSHGLPDTLEQLMSFGAGNVQWQEFVDQQCQPLWQRDTLLVLFSPAVQSAALDLESKFSEAALGTIQLADLRNFAHGRHNWLAKRGDSTAVLVLQTERDRELADRTLARLPKEILTAKIAIPTATMTATGVAAIVAAIQVAGCAGDARNIDPGRPGVPEFGSRIYHLRVRQRAPAARKAGNTAEDVAIARKLAVVFEGLNNDMALWRQAYRAFIRSFDRITFKGVVFDYDGTLCDARNRFSGLSEEMVGMLLPLLKKGIGIGIATGRGKSVRRDLQEKLPKKLWDRVLVGYYNAAVIGSLADDDLPGASVTPTAIIAAVASAVERHLVLARMAIPETRASQVSLQPKTSGLSSYIWRLAQQLVQSFPGVQAVISSHSVDLLGPGVSKRQLVERLQKELVGKGHLLTIGDKGAWPGNDYALLALPHSLSVDEVSAEPDSCWNLASIGHRGPQATIDYLRAFELSKEGIRLDCSRLEKSRSTNKGEA